MLNGQPFLGLPTFPKSASVLTKIALGVFLAAFILSYQPQFSLSFPPLKKSVVLAQTEQFQVVNPQPQPISFQLPHPGYITTHFSSYHPGIDLCSGLGMPIKPVAKGTVINAGFDFWGLGLTVEIDHGNGFKSLYAHLGKIYVKKNQQVSESDLIGEVGLTGHTSGPHTHLEISKDGKNFDPLSVLPKVRDYPEESDFIVYNSSPSATLVK